MKIKFIIKTIVFLFAVFGLCAFIFPKISSLTVPVLQPEKAADAEDAEARTAEKAEIPASILLQAKEAAAALGVDALAAQVIMTGVDANGFLGEAEKAVLSAVPAGAVMLFRKNLTAPVDGIIQTNMEISAVISASCGIKPFIAVDHEGGDVQRFTNAAALPPPLSYWEKAQTDGWETAILQIKTDAAYSGAELRKMGVNLNLAPVAEIFTAENAGFLKSRSYGPAAAFVEKAAASFAAGMEESGVLCVVKHFPGNSSQDPHVSKPVWNADIDTLKSLTSPFSYYFKTFPAGAVMISHVIVSAWDGEQNASLSPQVIKRLREEYGFNGLIIADDFSMGAVSGGLATEEYAVRALKSGVDMVMSWPANYRSTHNAIVRAVENSGLPKERLLEAAARVIAAKHLL
ncbi:MAG: glycoside hydrolase family 3 protein [Spirochaetaceae bacterium]|jgi:beta-N-acetylhexosaminidase|nr:glycoside hydrolase family 3 protein [Spirochaetaceae bacterium]